MTKEAVPSGGWGAAPQAAPCLLADAGAGGVASSVWGPMGAQRGVQPASLSLCLRPWAGPRPLGTAQAEGWGCQLYQGRLLVLKVPVGLLGCRLGSWEAREVGAPPPQYSEGKGHSGNPALPSRILGLICRVGLCLNVPTGVVSQGDPVPRSRCFYLCDLGRCSLWRLGPWVPWPVLQTRGWRQPVCSACRPLPVVLSPGTGAGTGRPHPRCPRRWVSCRTDLSPAATPPRGHFLSLLPTQEASRAWPCSGAAR